MTTTTWTVFPARAGMSPHNRHTRIIQSGFPRPRGDEPIFFKAA